MSKVTMDLVKELRERTGIGMAKCKSALEEANGDIDLAIENLRKAGLASAQKKEGRETHEGIVGVGESSKAIALVEVNSETDFVAENDRFKEFVKNICQQAAETLPASVEDLLAQQYSKDSSITIDQYRSLQVQTLAENIQVRRVLILKKNPNSSIGIYSHMGGKLATAVEIKGATDLQDFAREIGMHIAAENPEYLNESEVPENVKEKEMEIARSQVQGKPANIVDKIVQGKLKAFYDQFCLVNQKYIKDTTITIADLVAKRAKEIGKPLELVRFVRWRMGE
jgi:elongation factor Ts